MSHYDTLNVSEDADQKEIKNQYRKLALRYHPDQSNRKDTKQKFISIHKAYEILSDPKKRKKYDENRNKDTSGLKDNINEWRQNRHEKKARRKAEEHAETTFEDFREWLKEHGDEIAESAIKGFFVGTAIYFVVPAIAALLMGVVSLIPVLGSIGYGLGAGFLGIGLLLFWDAPGAAGCWVAFGKFILLPAILISMMTGEFEPSSTPIVVEFIVAGVGTLLLYSGANTLYKKYNNFDS